jgi:asparagine synthase (glutamine-hydrolysing)
MCGITGSYGESVRGLGQTLDALEHRGPDGYGVKHLINGTLGHTRLAIIDVWGGDQPLANQDKTQWLVCNGEIYNHEALRDQHPHFPYQTDSDSEVILALFEQHGTDTASMLDGMFAFALVAGDTFYMARDPLGIKPLYYGYDGDVLHFASEMKALTNKVEKVEEFPPGTWYSNHDGFVRYYDLEQIGEDAWERAQDKPATIQDVRESLWEAVRKRLMSDVPLGVYLSGGLDSTIVSAIVAQELDEVHSFSVGVAGSEDIAHARKAADYLGTIHHEYIYTPHEMMEALSDVIYHLESFDPSLVRSAIPNYFLARMTREYVTVVLTGEGADELYAGYHYLKEHAETPDKLHDELIKLTGTLYNCNLQRCDRMTMAHSIEGRVPFLDTDFIETSLAVPITEKITPNEGIEKWALRKAFEDILPDNVAWRVKEQFSKGAGSSHIIEAIANAKISDAEFEMERQDALRQNGVSIHSKEMLLYYREFVRHFGHEAASLIQVWAGRDVA